MSNSALLLSLKELDNIIEKENLNLLIIDTINNHYNSELADKSISFNKTKEKFYQILKKINELTLKYNLIVIVSAQVSSKFGNDLLIPFSPIGNQLLNQFFSEYLYLDYKEQDKRYIQLVNSSNLPEKRLLYNITSSGIQDFKV